MLKTEIMPDGSIYDHWKESNVAHDVAYAHALVMAMEEFEENKEFNTVPSVKWIRRKAAELMAEWGYTDD